MSARIPIVKVNAMDRRQFVDVFGGIYEHSSWVAERAWAGAPFADTATLREKMRAVVRAAGPELQFGILRSHPRLGIKTDMTACSQAEQSGSGLLDAERGARELLVELNAAYDRKFDFPFIVAVRGLGVSDIVASLKERLENDAETEFAESLRQVHRIAGFRLTDIIA